MSIACMNNNGFQLSIGVIMPEFTHGLIILKVSLITNLSIFVRLSPYPLFSALSIYLVDSLR